MSKPKPKSCRKSTLNMVIKERNTALSECNRFKQMCCDLQNEVALLKQQNQNLRGDLVSAKGLLDSNSNAIRQLHREIDDLKKELEKRYEDSEAKAKIEAILPRVEAFEKAVAEGKTASDAILAGARAEADKIRRVDSQELANIKAQMIRNRSTVLGLIAALRPNQPVDTVAIIGELQKMTW